MKNILTIVLLFFVTVSFAQKADSTYIKPKFNTGTPEGNELYIYGMNHSFTSADILHEQLELSERLDLYRKKGNRRKIWGASMMGVGLAGLWYVAEMDEPIYLKGDPNDPLVKANNDAADDQKNKRKYVAWPSALLAGAGAIIFVDSFKFNKWTKLDLGLNQIRITQELYGNASHRRKYYTDKESKLKKKSLWRNSLPRYRN